MQEYQHHTSEKYGHPKTNINKGFSITSSQATKGTVLFILSTADKLFLKDGSSVPTGIFISEFAETLQNLSAAGYDVEFASLEGKFPIIDTYGLTANFYLTSELSNDYSNYYANGVHQLRLCNSINFQKILRVRDADINTAFEFLGIPKFNDEARRAIILNSNTGQNDLSRDPELSNFMFDVNKRLKSIELLNSLAKNEENRIQPAKMLRLEDFAENLSLLDRYAGVYVPGGHAPKMDLLKSQAVGKILTYLKESQIPLAIICHAPIILGTTLPGGWHYGYDYSTVNKDNFPYHGYSITLGVASEEILLENIFYLRNKRLQFYVETEARKMGLNVIFNRLESQSQVVCDRYLCTGANPASVKALTNVFVEMLERKPIPDAVKTENQVDRGYSLNQGLIQNLIKTGVINIEKEVLTIADVV